MKVLNLAQIQQVAGGVIAIQAVGRTFAVSDESISAVCAQALPSIIANSFSLTGLTQSPCSTGEIELFRKRYDKAVLDSFNSERTFHHKPRINFAKMVRR